jgi:sodium/potassium-transporting ATPase subunit alpha
MQVFNSTLIVNGEGWGGMSFYYIKVKYIHKYSSVVVRTGDQTFIGTFKRPIYIFFFCSLYLGQIASLTGGESGNESPLAVEM